MNSNLEPYPERDLVADAPIVVEPITIFADRVWYGPRSFDFYVRSTPDFVTCESARLAHAWTGIDTQRSPIGSRFD